MKRPMHKRVLFNAKCRRLHCNGVPMLVTTLDDNMYHVECAACGEKTQPVVSVDAIDLSEWA